MCLNPRKIKNNSLDFCKGRDAEFYYVPCGHCAECRNAKRSDFTFRCIAESLTTESDIYYYTLTFNDEHLPNCVIDSPEDGHTELTYSCFSKSLVQKFMKRLRKYLKKEYDIEMRYLLTSEFGDKEKRPHHHALFYLPKGYVNAYQFRKIITWFWSEPSTEKIPNLRTIKTSDEVLTLVGKRSYGFNHPGKYCGRVYGINPLQYVCKYVAKDLAFYENFVDLDKLKKGVYVLINDIRTFDFYAWKNECCPFTLMSNNFGCKILDKFTFEDLVRGTYDVVAENGKVKTFIIPMYMLKKILFISGLNENGNMHYMINKLGFEVRKAQLDQRIKDDIINLGCVSQVIKKYGCRQIGLYAFDNAFYSQDDVIKVFDNLTYDDCKLIAEYRNFYRNKLMCYFDLDFKTDYDTYYKMQTKLRKVPFLFYPSTIFNDCFDVLTLEQLTQIYEICIKFLKKQKAIDNIHKEKLFKINYYGAEYLEESEIEILSL